MTFKHIKFEDSVVMRSLEKLANEKGLVKKDALTKQASATKPSKPASDSLVEKVIFLCSQLRAAKFEKHAQELESKLMAYKKANTLYETSSEKGEDLVQQAHPKGSYKLQGIDSSELAIIETIIDQQLKNIKMIDKKPTGKLANHDIIKAVKIALAESKDEVWEQLMKKVNFVKSRVQQVYDALGVPYSIGNMILDPLNDPTIDNIKKAQQGFVMYYNRVKPGLLMGVSEDLWSTWEQALSRAGYALTDALALRQKYNNISSKELAPTPEEQTTSSDEKEIESLVKGTKTLSNIDKELLVSPDAKAFTSESNKAMLDLRNWTIAVNGDPDNSDADKAAAKKWISNKMTIITNLQNEFNNLSKKDANELGTGYLISLRKNLTDMDKFRSEWIG